MKVSTSQFFRTNANALSKGQSSVSDLQAKLGSGKQLTSPSQDSKKTNQISRLESALQRQGVYKANIQVAKTRLTMEETALTSITEVLQRASELAIQGANGTMAAWPYGLGAWLQYCPLFGCTTMGAELPTPS